MRKRPDARWLMLLFVLLLSTCGALAAVAFARSDSRAPTAPQTSSARAEPWSSAQTVEPNALAKELAGPSPRPTVVCVGLLTLYRGGHVPGASFRGPASTSEGLADLKRWAQHVPRTSDVVLYCGCCPFAECPNVRPAFTALRDMGFTHVRVLLLPHNFGTDWVGSGFPVER